MSTQTGPPAGVSLSRWVFRQIEQSILSGEYAPGEALVETKLSAKLGVSRTPVREALCQLELDGLVHNTPNKGTVVVGVSERDIDDIYTIRSLIEGMAARWAAEYITEQEISELTENVELQEFYLARADIERVRTLDDRFHAILYDACRSRIIRQMLSNLHHHILQARADSLYSEGRASAAVAEHRKILSALQERDGAAAEQCTCEHIVNAKKNMFRTR